MECGIMVDVKSYSCFPTMVYEFKGIDKANHLKMLNIVDFENENNKDPFFNINTMEDLEIAKKLLENDKL